jgi:hypothetical protein
VSSSETDALNSIESTLTALAALRPSRVDPAHYSVKAKIPSKIAALRAGLLYRLVELANVSLQCLKSGQLAAAIVLARSGLETTVALWFATRKIERALEAKRVDHLDDDVMKLLLGFKGSKPFSETTEAINVLTFFGYVGKDIEELEIIYADLSEYAHPNWAGTASLYSKPDLANLRLEFGPTQSTNAAPAELARVTLMRSMVAFKHLHKQIDTLMPKLIELTEGEHH